MLKPPVQKPKQQDFIKTALRIPKTLHESLVAAADNTGHSLNDEMLARLNTSQLAELTRQHEELKMLMRQILTELRS